MVACSCGVNVKTFIGSENPSAELQTMEREAEILLAHQKLLKAEKALKEVVVLGEKLDLEEYINQVCELWGAKRIGSDVLKIILDHVVCKTKNSAS